MDEGVGHASIFPHAREILDFLNLFTASILPLLVLHSDSNLSSSIPTQAYRLEPLINPLYSQCRQVKVDSPGRKASGDCVDLAGGPLTDKDLEEQYQQLQTKNWWGGFSNVKRTIVSMAATLGSSGVDQPDSPNMSAPKTPMPEKVRLRDSPHVISPPPPFFKTDFMTC